MPVKSICGYKNLKFSKLSLVMKYYSPFDFFKPFKNVKTIPSLQVYKIGWWAVVDHSWNRVRSL